MQFFPFAMRNIICSFTCSFRQSFLLTFAACQVECSVILSFPTRQSFVYYVVFILQRYIFGFFLIGDSHLLGGPTMFEYAETYSL